MNEKDVERHFSHWLNEKNFCWIDQVDIEGSIADFVYEESDGSIVAVEAKGGSKDKIWKGFTQAITYTNGSHFTYLLIPNGAVEIVDDQIVDRTGIGVLSVSDEGKITEVYPSKKNSPSTEICDRIRRELKKAEEKEERKATGPGKRGEARKRILDVLKEYKALTPNEIKKITGITSVDSHLRTLIARGKVKILGKKKREGLSTAVWPRFYALADIDKNQLEEELKVKFWPERGSIDLIPQILDSPMTTEEIRKKLSDMNYEVSQSTVYHALRELAEKGIVTQMFSEKGRNAIWIRSEDKEKYRGLEPRDAKREIVNLLKRESPKQVKEIVEKTGWSKEYVQHFLKKLLKDKKVYIAGKRENYRLYAHPRWHGTLREDFLGEVKEKILTCLLEEKGLNPFDICKSLRGDYTYDTIRTNLRGLEEDGYVRKSGRKGGYSLFELTKKGKEYLKMSKVSFHAEG